MENTNITPYAGLKKALMKVGLAMTIWTLIRILFAFIDIAVLAKLQASGVTDGNTLMIIDLAFSAVAVYLIATPIAVWMMGFFKDGKLKSLFKKSETSLKETAFSTAAGYYSSIMVNFICVMTVIIIVVAASGSMEDAMAKIMQMNPALNMPTGGLGTALNYVWMVLFAPLFEELLVRGAVLNTLKPYGKWFAIIASAVLFGCMHGGLIQMCYATMLGIVLGIIATRANSIVPSIMAHMAINLIGASVSAAMGAQNLPVMIICMLLSGAISLTGFICLILFLVKYRDRVKFGDGKELTKGKKLAAIFTTPTVITMIVVMAGFMSIVKTPAFIEWFAGLFK